MRNWCAGPRTSSAARRAGRRPTALNLDASLLYVGSWIDGSRDFSVPRLNAHPYWTADLAASYALTDNSDA